MWRFSLIYLLTSIATFSTANPVKDLKPVGQSTLKVLFWDVYEATLYSRDGVYTSLTPPLTLKLTYLRDISREDLIAATDKELQRQKPGLSDTVRNRAIEHFSSFWPDVSKGDSLIFTLQDHGGFFYYRDRQIGQVQSSDAAKAFLNIWLSDQSSYPNLSAKLRGVQ